MLMSNYYDIMYNNNGVFWSTVIELFEFTGMGLTGFSHYALSRLDLTRPGPGNW